MTVTFSEEMVASGINTASIKLFKTMGGTNVAVTGTVSCTSPCTVATFDPNARGYYSGTGRRRRWVPLPSLDYYSTYQLRVLTNARDLAGNQLTPEVAVNFTTELSPDGP